MGKLFNHHSIAVLGKFARHFQFVDVIGAIADLR